MSQKFVCSSGGSVEADRRKLQWGLVTLALAVFAVAGLLFVRGVVGSALILTLVGVMTVYAARMARDLDLLWIELDPGGGDEALVLQLRRRRLARPAPRSARTLTAEENEHLKQLTRWSGFQVATGGYESRMLGEIEVYTSNLDRPVLLELTEEALVVTPDEPDRLVTAVHGGGIDLYPG